MKDFIYNMARFFKNLPKKTKPIVDVDSIRLVVANLEVCDSKVEHPVALPGVHHYHDVPFLGPICCKCGMDKAKGEKISGSNLKEVRKNYW